MGARFLSSAKFLSVKIFTGQYVKALHPSTEEFCFRMPAKVQGNLSTLHCSFRNLPDAEPPHTTLPHSPGGTIAIGDANRLQRCFISPQAALEKSGEKLSWPLRRGEGVNVLVQLVCIQG